MSEPLSLEHFDETMRTIADVLTEHTTKFTTIADTLVEHTQRFNKIDDRLDRIEKLLWQGERLNEIENRVIKIAEAVGDSSLARPFTRPISS